MKVISGEIKCYCDMHLNCLIDLLLDQGEPGLPGDRGGPGIKGMKGAAGDQGKKGDPGPKGLSVSTCKQNRSQSLIVLENVCCKLCGSSVIYYQSFDIQLGLYIKTAVIP